MSVIIIFDTTEIVRNQLSSNRQYNV